MTTYLDAILADKRADLAATRSERPGAVRVDSLGTVAPTRDFAAALTAGPAPRVIAEFKRASPSRGSIRKGAAVAEIVTAYEAAGAAAISVLTDRHFEGSFDDLRAARAVTQLPLLCKDFILERSQLVDARRAGADAVLLIVAALPAPGLRPLIEAAHALDLAVLCEAHDEHEVDRAMSAGARVIGVNARDLKTFEVDLDRALQLRRRVPRSFVYVAESGVQTPEHVADLRQHEVDAVLVGTALMGADDPGAALRELLGR